MFGNVNVDYKPCKSATQLQRAADYILGRQAEQIRDGVVKTAPNLYWGINCDRDNFLRDVLMTRELFGKQKSKNANLAYKMSFSFHPDDNDKLTYDEAFRIAKEFADKFLKGYEALFALHTDSEHIHVRF
ncbi:MAG: relaxase/mobilization nuclease domain-containing protein [Clostridium sp.]|nr:relaxase/mobilization nuclease domain-containing protein [Clostridium sp.]